MKVNKNFPLITVIFALLVLTTFLSSCQKKNAGAVAAEETEAVFAVNATKAVPRTLDDYLSFGGNVQVADSVDIFPDTQSGKIAQLYVKVGDTVSRWQKVADVDPSRPGMEYNLSPVRAPVSGTIISFPLSRGATVSAQTSIGKIGSTGKLEIKTNIAERFISRVALNQSAELTFDAYPDVKFPAVLTEIDPTLDVSSRTLGVKLIVEPPDSRLKAGMYARIKLITDTKENVIVVPSTVIVNRNDESVVYVVNTQTNTAKACVVKLGIKVDTYQEIEQGIAPGDLIVTKGQALLTDGAKVRVAAIEE